MDPITIIRSRTVVMPSTNIDTDQIIPAQFLKVTDKNGLADALFFHTALWTPYFATLSAPWSNPSPSAISPSLRLSRRRGAICEMSMTESLPSGIGSPPLVKEVVGHVV